MPDAAPVIRAEVGGGCGDPILSRLVLCETHPRVVSLKSGWQEGGVVLCQGHVIVWEW